MANPRGGTVTVRGGASNGAKYMAVERSARTSTETFLGWFEEGLIRSG